jgi:hypothetical protein
MKNVFKNIPHWVTIGLVVLIILILLLIRMNWSKNLQEVGKLENGMATTIKGSNQSLPEDVAAVVKRYEACLQLNDEGSGDDARHSELEAISEKFGCDTVLKAREQILKKYRGNSEVEDVLNADEEQEGDLDDTTNTEVPSETPAEASGAMESR